MHLNAVLLSGAIGSVLACAALAQAATNYTSIEVPGREARAADLSRFGKQKLYPGHAADGSHHTAPEGWRPDRSQGRADD